MKTITFFYPKGHQGHAQTGHPERPERVEVIRQRLEATGHWELGAKLKAAEVEREVLEGVHSAEHLERLEALSKAGQAYDHETYLTHKSWELALQAAGGAIAVAEEVWERRADKGFALTRPPGHHATPERAMGFCLINNVAVAAENLLTVKGAKRVAIIDIDVHHGNGTQDIFYGREDVFFCSLHQSPLYPGTGMLTETGVEIGDGYTQNIPLPPYSGDEGYMAALEEVVLPTLARIEPEMLLISFGYDAHWRDPLGSMQLSASGYHQLLDRFRAFAGEQCEGRLAVLLEGGYDLEAGAANGQAVVQGLLGEAFVDELGEAPQPEGRAWERVLSEAKRIWEL